jgi:hypothetical protein
MVFAKGRILGFGSFMLAAIAMILRENRSAGIVRPLVQLLNHLLRVG